MLTIDSTFLVSLNVFNQGCDKGERFLSCISSIPFVGMVSGIAKITLGITQTIMGLAILAFATIAKLFIKNETQKILKEFGLMHVVHGLSNGVAGIVESLPVVGSFIFSMRMHNGGKSAIQAYREIDYIYQDKNFKFLSYHQIDLKVPEITESLTHPS